MPQVISIRELQIQKAKRKIDSDFKHCTEEERAWLLKDYIKNVLR